MDGMYFMSHRCIVYVYYEKLNVFDEMKMVFVFFSFDLDAIHFIVGAEVLIQNRFFFFFQIDFLQKFDGIIHGNHRIF